MKKLGVLIMCIVSMGINAQTNSIISSNEPNKMEWFEDAKLGIFIHYGIYAVQGTGESWPIYNNEISYKDYMNQLKGFTAKNYHPNDWAKLFKEAGAKYVVLTAKHHDGVALWDTKQSDLNVVKKSPAKRDLIAPYAQAMRTEGLKVGMYFSHIDWSNPNYASVFDGKDKNPKNPNSWDYPKSGKEDTAKWNKFLAFNTAQLRELKTIANPDLWWFDGDWTRTAEQWKMKELRQNLLTWNPKAILNSRMQGYGDYVTPEQGIPIFAPDGPWELCMTINDSWGYRPSDNNQKSLNYIIRIFSECIGLGGNLLLDAGPMEDGTITTIQTERLKGLGRWTSKHAEAIYGSQRGMPLGHFYGPTTLSKDKKTIYCFILDIPKDDIVIKGIHNKIKQVRLIGSNENLKFKLNGGAAWLNIPPVLLVELPTNKLDENVTVIAIDLDTPLELYRGTGGAIEKN